MKAETAGDQWNWNGSNEVNQMNGLMNATTTIADPKHPVPNGVYTVAIKKVQYQLSKKQLIPQLWWVLEILEGPHQGLILNRYNTINQSTSALNLLNNDLKLCGVVYNTLGDLLQDSLFQPLVGHKLQVRVENQERGYKIWLLKKYGEK